MKSAPDKFLGAITEELDDLIAEHECQPVIKADESCDSNSSLMQSIDFLLLTYLLTSTGFYRSQKHVTRVAHGTVPLNEILRGGRGFPSFCPSTQHLAGIKHLSAVWECSGEQASINHPDINNGRCQVTVHQVRVPPGDLEPITGCQFYSCQAEDYLLI